MDFLIYYETVPREYENACLLKYELERRGYSVKICNTIRRDFWKSRFYSPKVVIVPGIYNDSGVNFFINKDRKQKKQKVVDLRYEQLVTKDKNGAPMNLPKDWAKPVYHICWGEAGVEELSSFGIDKKYLVKIGPLQFDLARKEFSGYFKTRQEIADEFGIDKDKKWVLFVSSLAYGMLSKEEAERMAKETIIPYFLDYTEYMRKMVVLLREWIERFLNRHPDVYYIYRPHPSEPMTKEFDVLLKKYPNFRVIRDYSVKQWFRVTDIVNTWNSTAIMEGYYCKKRCCVIDIPKEEKYQKFRILSIDQNKIIRTFEEFEEFNMATKDFDENDYPIERKESAYYYNNMQDIPVYYQLCDFLEKVLKNDSYYEVYSPVITEKMQKALKNAEKMTLRGNVQLLTFPFINRIFPSKCKMPSLLEQHRSKRLKKIENKIKKEVMKVSGALERRDMN